MGNRRRQRRTAPMAYSTHCPDLARLLGSLAPARAPSGLALLLMGRGRRGSLLAPRHWRRGFHEGTAVQGRLRLPGPSHHHHWRRSSSSHHGPRGPVHCQWVQTLAPTSRDSAPFRSRWQVRQHRDHRAAHTYAEKRMHAATDPGSVPSRRLRQGVESPAPPVQHRATARNARRENSRRDLLLSTAHVPFASLRAACAMASGGALCRTSCAHPWAAGRPRRSRRAIRL